MLCKTPKNQDKNSGKTTRIYLKLLVTAQNLRGVNSERNVRLLPEGFFYLICLIKLIKLKQNSNKAQEKKECPSATGSIHPANVCCWAFKRPTCTWGRLWTYCGSLVPGARSVLGRSSLPPRTVCPRQPTRTAGTPRLTYTLLHWCSIQGCNKHHYYTVSENSVNGVWR